MGEEYFLGGKEYSVNVRCTAPYVYINQVKLSKTQRERNVLEKEDRNKNARKKSHKWQKLEIKKACRGNTGPMFAIRQWISCFIKFVKHRIKA